MRDFSRIKFVLDLAGDFEDSNTDQNFAERMEKSTKKLLKVNPETTKEEVISYLVISARNSYFTMIYSDSLEPLVDTSISLINSYAKACGDENLSAEEECVLRLLLRDKYVFNFLHKSFRISLKVVNDLWNGMRGMES